MIKELQNLTRMKAYVFSFLLFVLVLLSGIFTYIFGSSSVSFIANIFVSIAASILASIIVAVFIDFSDYKKQKEFAEKEHDNTFFLLKFYTLNLNFQYITESIGGSHNKIDASLSSYDLMIAKHKEYNQLVAPGKRYTKTLKQFHNDMFLSCEYYLRMISMTLLDAVNKNSTIHCFDKYIIHFMDINQYIIKLFDKKATKMIASDFSNILDLLMNLSPIVSDFKKPISEFKDLIPVLFIIK